MIIAEITGSLPAAAGCLAAAIGVASARFYEVSALLVPTSMGIVAATIVMVLANLEWSWIIAGSGALVGLLFGSFAIISSLHRVVLTVMTALCGAAVCVAGLMLAVNTIDRTDLGIGHTTVRVAHTPWWWIAGLAAAVGYIFLRNWFMDWLIMLRTLSISEVANRFQGFVQIMHVCILNIVKVN